MDDNKPKPYADLRVKIGEYQKDGETKGRYATIGTLFASPHFSNMYLNVDTLPVTKDWDGRVYISPREKKESGYDTFKQQGAKLQKDEVILPNEEPISLEDIPFN